MTKRNLSIFATCFLLAVFIFPAQLLAAPYYEGKVISIIVGSEAGGGYDRMARLLAKYLPAYIPGKPSVIIQNMVGAGGLISANHLYNLAKPDGLTIGTFNRGLLFSQLSKVEGVRFDLTKFSWIGSPSIEPNVLCIRGDLPYKTYQDLLKAKNPIIAGDVGLASIAAKYTILLKEYTGLKVKMVSYPATPDVYLALERKEVEATAGGYYSMLPQISSGLLRPVLRGRVSLPVIEKLPLDEDFTPDKMKKTLFAMLSSGDLVGRPFVAPPKTPEAEMNILRNAFAQTTKDPELLKDADKAQLRIQYVTAEKALEVVNFISNQPSNVIEEFTKYIKF